MDYRHYRGETPSRLQKFEHHFHLLRYIGAGMMAATVIIAWLMVLKIIDASLWIFFLSYFLFLVGVVFVLIGNSYNTYADRSD